jgi:spore coat protein CotH
MSPDLATDSMARDVDPDTTEISDEADLAAPIPSIPWIGVEGVLQLALEVDPTDWDFLETHPDSTDEVTCSIVLDGQRFANVDLELHGGFARSVPKKSYRLELPDEPDAFLDLFGDGPEPQRRFVLKASYIDPTFLREWLTLGLVRAEGGLAPRVAFTEVAVNGRWHGLYLLVERIDRPYLRRHDLGHEAVQLYKAESHHANWQDKPNPLDGYDIELGDEAHATDLADLLDRLSHTPLSAEDFEREVAPRLALDDVLIWHRVHTFAGNRDTFTKNYYLQHDLATERPFRLISWDADATFGLDWDGTPTPGDETAWHGSDRFSPRLFAITLWRSRHVLGYRDALMNRWRPDVVALRLRDLAANIAPVAEADLAYWKSRFSYDAEVERLLEMLETRHALMSAILDSL